MITSRVGRMDLRNTGNFKITNKIWNELSLNHAWSIGYLTFLCKKSKATSFKEWEKYYFHSGSLRQQLINKLPEVKRQALLDTKLYIENKQHKLNLLSKDEKTFNTHMGRTMNELYQVAKELYKGVLSHGIKDISLDDCENYTYIRVIDETWLGMERELNTKVTLKSLFPDYEVKEVSVSFDTRYGVDFELYKNNKIILGIQVKSEKYFNDKSDILLKTKKLNNSKHSNYTRDTGVEVVYVYSDIIGRIKNKEELLKAVS